MSDVNITITMRTIDPTRLSITKCPRSTSRNRNSSPGCPHRNSGEKSGLSFLKKFSRSTRIVVIIIMLSYSQGSYRTYRTAPPYTEDATLRSKTSKRGGIVIESSRAPHPMCPNTRSCCCLMLLFNLGLLLVCLGFVIVLQLNDPPFVW